MTVFKARCIWPGKDFDNDKTPGKKKTSATFLPEGIEDKKENYVKVNSSDSTNKKAQMLKALKKGQDVYLIHSGNYEGNPYYDVAQFKGAGLMPVEVTGGATSSANGSADKSDKLEERCDLYVAAFLKLRDKFDQAQITIEDDQLSMMASSIAKAI